MPEEKITYEQVHEGVEEIRKQANIMEEIYNNVTGEVNKMTAPDTFQGVASNAFSNEFSEFKGTFPVYLQQVREFATAYDAASQVLKETETQMAKKAEQL